MSNSRPREGVARERNIEDIPEQLCSMRAESLSCGFGNYKEASEKYRPGLYIWLIVESSG
jgi:hypothetical protein